MLQLISQPNPITFARNPIAFKFRSVNMSGNPYGTGLGIHCDYRFGANCIPVGSTLTILWSDPSGIPVSLTLSAAASPNTIDEFQGSPAAASLVYAQNIAATIGAHPHLAPFFDVSAYQSGANIYLRIAVKELVSGWTVAFLTDGIPLSDDGIITTPTVTLYNLPYNYKVHVQIFIESDYRSGDYELVASVDDYPDALGYTTFNIGQIISAEVEQSLSEPPLPAVDTSTIQLADNLRRYFIRYNESSGSPASYTGYTWIEPLLVMYGGIDNALFAEGDFFTKFSAEQSILTWYPDGKSIATDQPEYLPYIQHLPDVNKRPILELTTFDADNAQIGVTFPYSDSLTYFSTWETALIPISVNALGLSGSVAKFKVRVLDGDSAWDGGEPVYLSQPRTYYITRKHRRDSQYLFYLNGFGVPLTIRCTGRFEKDLETARDTGIRVIGSSFAPTERQRFQYNFDFKNPVTYRSGYYSKKEVDALQECMMYNHLYQLIDGRYIPLLQTKQKFDITKSGQFLHSITFTAIRALDPVNYSNDEIGDIIVTPQNRWLTEDGQAWITEGGQEWIQ